MCTIHVTRPNGGFINELQSAFNLSAIWLGEARILSK